MAPTPILLVIVASTRPGRVGRPVADWFRRAAEDHGGFSIDEADLAEVDLPFLDEPKHPRLGDYEHDHTKAWGARVDAADAVVIVTPEYNHSFPATIKNALDTVSREWAHKPLGYVSYGGISGGTRAVAALEPVAAVLQLRAVPQAVHLPFPHQHLDDHGVLQAPEPAVVGARAMLDELEAMVGVLAHRRSA